MVSGSRNASFGLNTSKKSLCLEDVNIQELFTKTQIPMKRVLTHLGDERTPYDSGKSLEDMHKRNSGSRYKVGPSKEITVV